MSSSRETIAIAGAGIGGLATALALAQNSVCSTVYERRQISNEAGAGIQLGPNATRILAKLGVLDAILAHASAPDALTVHSADQNCVLARLPLGQWMQDRHGAPYLTLHRQDLHAVLREAALSNASIAIHDGRDVIDYCHSNGAVDLEFGDGARARADALIAADGLWSKMRGRISPSATLSPFGKCAYRTVVPASLHPKALAPNDVHIWLSSGAHVVHYPVRQGREFAMIVVVDGSASASAWNSAASMPKLAGSAVASFPEPVQDIVFATHEWRMWPLQTLTPLTRWTDERVALLGDAAHPLLPFFAQGGGLALEDAAVMARCLAVRDQTMSARLKAFEVQRRSRADRLIKASESNGRIYHLKGMAAAARNQVLRRVPSELLMKRYDWLYGWAA
jgi:salicylate hydroxylase